MFEFISPTSPRHQARSTFDALSLALVAPQAYFGENLLVRHIRDALIWTETELALRNHINPETHKGLEMASYYADDAEAVAWCAEHNGAYLATVGIAFVRRLVKISQRLEESMLPLALSKDRTAGQRKRARDDALAQLLSGETAVSTKEALGIVAAWPKPGKQEQRSLGAFAVFYDLLRLVWMHEWAHALCGHAAVAKSTMGLAQMHEFSAARQEARRVPEVGGYPANEVLQAMEIHADEFAVRYLVGEILWGSDPVGDLAGPHINLVERLVIFNLACCVFAVIWSSAEQRYQPGLTFYPPRPALASNDLEPLYVTFPTSHPPAALRYMRFRDFQADLTLRFASHNPGVAQLFAQVDAHSFLLLDELANLDPRFYQLRADTPGVSKTPEVKRLIAYEERLLEIGTALTPLLEKACFVPTADPTAEREP